MGGPEDAAAEKYFTPPLDPYGVLDLTRKLHGEPTVETALHIIQWELGDLAKSWTYARWHPDLANAYMAEAKKALSDLLFQAYVVAALLDASPAELLQQGVETVEDRIKDKEKKVGRFEFYKGDKKNG